MASVIIGDYEYTASSGNTCSCKAVDKTKTSYADIPTSVTISGATYTVRDLSYCFELCKSMVTPPSLPSTTRSLMGCFAQCMSLRTPPSIPASTTTLANCFYSCSSLETPPDLSALTDVVNMDSCFQGCASMTTAPVIPPSVTDIDRCFRDCSSMVTSPPNIPNSVTSMVYAFYGCASMTSAPAIPSGVTNLNSCFDGCASLTDAPEIPVNVDRMNSCFCGCASLVNAPTIPSLVFDLGRCFDGCTSLTDAPDIPASVTRMDYCFRGCSSLTGNVKVYTSSIASNYMTRMFYRTEEDIYIVNGAGTSAVESMWKGIASGYSNIHYEADDNPGPALSFTVTRVGGMASETPSPNGQYAFINATAVVYETYLPDGWSCNYDEGGENLTNDSVTQSPYWTRTPDGNVWNLKCWLSLGDTTKHTFTLQVADEITDENDNVKVSQLSAIITQIISKAYKLVDYYHDPTTDTEGMSIGKFATDANLFDVDMPALFRDTATMGETIIDEPYFSLDTTASSGVDHDLYSAITALGWQSDVVV